MRPAPIAALAALTVLFCGALTACDKYGAGTGVSRLLGNWAEVKLPDGCRAKQIAADERGGIAVLCDDGRLFH